MRIYGRASVRPSQSPKARLPELHCGPARARHVCGSARGLAKRRAPRRPLPAYARKRCHRMSGRAPACPAEGARAPLQLIALGGRLSKLFLRGVEVLAKLVAALYRDIAPERGSFVSIPQPTEHMGPHPKPSQAKPSKHARAADSTVKHTATTQPCRGKQTADSDLSAPVQAVPNQPPRRSARRVSPRDPPPVCRGRPPPHVHAAAPTRCQARAAPPRQHQKALKACTCSVWSHPRVSVDHGTEQRT
jgi:hypothetical protein